MIALLHVLGFTTALSGLAAVYFGFDIAATDRGMTYTIAGSIGLVGGLMVNGLAAIAWKLRVLQTSLALRNAVDHTRMLPDTVPPARAPLAAAAIAAHGAISAAGLTAVAVSLNDAEPKPELPQQKSLPDALAAPPAALPPEPVPGVPEPSSAELVSPLAVASLDTLRGRMFGGLSPPGGTSLPGAAAPDAPPAAPVETDADLFVPDKPSVSKAVIRTMTLDGKTFSIFADGSISAELKTGPKRFADLAEARRYFAAHEPALSGG